MRAWVPWGLRPGLADMQYAALEKTMAAHTPRAATEEV